jgi:xanthine dehydrogenase accessory factor
MPLMSDQASVLVCGLDPTASAAARMLLLSGYTVALHQSEPPPTLRRRMAYADAWFDKSATLEGVEARRVKSGAEFLRGLRERMFIPLLTQPFEQVVERWPWDVIVDATAQGPRPREPINLHARLSIGLGEGRIAGLDCDLVIETGGADPGAIIRQGGSSRRWSREGRSLAPTSGVFTTRRTIGELVSAGELLGSVGAHPLRAVSPGRILGLRRSGQVLVEGESAVEIADNPAATVDGVVKSDKLIARALIFAIEMELNGWTPVSLDRFL